MVFEAQRRSEFSSAGLRQFADRISVASASGSAVVALARKMPRLLEYLGVMDGASNVVSERALPWLEPSALRNLPTVFCDDVLNVGSTLNHYADYARRRFGIAPQILVYAHKVPEAFPLSKSPLTKYELEVQEKFTADAYWSFETALPQELLRGGKPYDIDFPVVEVGLPRAAAAFQPSDWYRFLSSIFPRVHNLTIATQADSGISSFTLMEPAPVAARWPAVKGYTPPGKVRVYVSSRERLMRIIPIVIPPVAESDLGDASSLPGDLQPLYSKVTRNVAEAEPFPLEPRYNLLVYLLSFDYLRHVLPRLLSCVPGGIQSAPALPVRDLQLIFGPTVAAELAAALNVLIAKPSGIAADEEEVASDDEQEIIAAKPELVNQIAAELTRRRFAGESAPRLFREAFRILGDLTGASDSTSLDRFPDYDRLRRGLALADLCAIVRRCSSVKISTDYLSFLLDYYIDIGAVVPVVEVINEHIYIRTYRRGEADPIELAQFIHNLLREHSELFPDKPLTKTAFTKILSALAIYHGAKIPLEPVFEFRGVVPFIASEAGVTEQLEDAIEFLDRQGYISLEPLPSEPDAQRRLFS